jgi:uncharacterized membrane protein YdjX (TVP38/TMEM64 family)
VPDEPASNQPPPSLADRLGITGALAIVTLSFPALGSIALFWAMGKTNLGPWLRGHAELGVAMYAGAFAVLAGVALLPTYAQCALGGWAFGFAWGFPAALVGFAGGSLIGYAIASRTAGERVEKLIEEKPKWKAVRDALLGVTKAGEKLTPKAFLKTTAMVALLRCPPNSPFAFTNLVMASVKVPLAPFMLGTMIGMAPRSALAVMVGAIIKDQFSKDAVNNARPAWFWPVMVGASLAVVIIVGLIANRAIKGLGAEPRPQA